MPGRNDTSTCGSGLRPSPGAGAAKRRKLTGRQCFGRLICVLVLTLSGYHAALAAPASPPLVPAAAYVLVDADTGQTLVAYNERLPRPIASTTKIMTAILALERGQMSDVVTASRRAASVGGTSMYLRPGERQRLDDLLHAMMLVSANDAAVAIAEHLAGSEAAFVEWMNARAQELGASRTRYANAYGFDDANHYSTAEDLALIARFALRNSAFRDLVAAPVRVIPPDEGADARHLTNRNPLLASLEGAFGVKNGYTDWARYTYVAAARRGDLELIAVVLGTEDSLWKPARDLLEYGFLTGTAPVTVAQPLPITAAADLTVVIPMDAAPPAVRMAWAEALPWIYLAALGATGTAAFLLWHRNA